MAEEKQKSARGRPRTITRERIADAGIALGLEGLTFVGVATGIGVTQMALYKHVDGIKALKQLVAEELFLRWELPDPQQDSNLSDYLHRSSLNMWELVRLHPGITPYLLRRDRITQPIVDKIASHQAEVAARFGLTADQSRTLGFTVAYHSIAVAEAALSDKSDGGPDFEAFHAFGLHAIISGALTLLRDDPKSLTQLI